MMKTDHQASGKLAHDLARVIIEHEVNVATALSALATLIGHSIFQMDEAGLVYDRDQIYSNIRRAADSHAKNSHDARKLWEQPVEGRA